MPDPYGTRQHKAGEDKGLHHRKGLRDHQHALTGNPVRQDPCKWSEEKNGHLSDESNEPQKKGRVGEPVDQPAHGRSLHNRPDQGDALATEKKPVIAVAKRPEGEVEIDGKRLLSKVKK